jgi:ABC-type antimicrobial peptide transport system permease subunit
MPWVMRYVVGPTYFETMGMRLVRGRLFTDRDDDHAPRAVVVDEAFARLHYPGGDAIGQRILTSDYGFTSAEIVGVVGHIKQWGLDKDETTTVRAQLYESFLQQADMEFASATAGVVVIARTRDDPGTVVPKLRSAVQALGADNVIFHVRTLDDIIGGYQTTRRFTMYVLAAFAALALLLSAIGIYGVVSYVVDQRTTEIGIRMALGARGRVILGLIVRQGAKLVIAGVVLGVGGALALSPVMGRLIYGVPSTDPVTLGVAAAVVIVLALVAILVPAWRAMRLEPIDALRAE